MSDDRSRALQMLQTAVQMEEKGHRYYDKQVAECTSDLARQIFEKLRDDEVVHVSRIKRIWSYVDRGQPWSDDWEDEGTVTEDLEGVFRELARSHGIEISADKGDLEALEMGIDFEQRAVAFYQNHMERTEGHQERQFIQRMISEERSHYAALVDIKYYLTDPEAWTLETERSGLDGA